MLNSGAEEPPRKKKKLSLGPPWLSSLPDEMIVSCLARVSRSDKEAVSMVCKSYQALMASPELYKIRSGLGCLENCVYVCLVTPPDPTPRWFVLRRGKPVLIPSSPSQVREASSVVVLDWGIYVIGGYIKRRRSSDVWLLDCRTHTWHYIPSMAVPRASAAAGVIGEKIYVFGGCSKKNVDSLDWAEVFDPKTQTWDSLPRPTDWDMRVRNIHDSIVVREEKIYAVIGKNTSDTFYYSPSEGQWGRGNTAPMQRNGRDWCVIDKLIYCIDRKGNLCWCEPEQLERESEKMYWRKVKGLVSLKKTLSSSRLVPFDSRFEAIWEAYRITIGIDEKLCDFLPGARLSSSGANILLFWDVVHGDHLEIWFAEISLERRKGPEIWANIISSYSIMTVDPFLHHYKVMHSVSVTL